MDEIIKTTLLEYEKSAFIIDLVKHYNGRQYISILQTIQDEKSDCKRLIKINPSLLSDIVRTLNSYLELITEINTKTEGKKTQIKTLSKVLSQSQKIAIQSRYLKGISIADLTIQFDCNEELILQILNNNGIVILENTLMPKKKYKKFRNRK